jgi:hypothetical protein
MFNKAIAFCQGQFGYSRTDLNRSVRGADLLFKLRTIPNGNANHRATPNFIPGEIGCFDKKQNANTPAADFTRKNALFLPAKTITMAMSF